MNDGFDLADQYNPVDALSNTIPGIGDVRSEDYIGVWHHVHVEAETNRYNDVRGLWWLGAGPTTGRMSGPGYLDVLFSSGLTLIGSTLNEDKAEGIDRYSKYDTTERLYWEAESIGITEFSGLHNLAQYGWDTFAASATLNSGKQRSALGLSWVLHALGDAAAPHHVVGTTGYRHVDFEAYIDEHLAFYFPSEADQPDEVAVDAQLRRIIENGFGWWKRLRDGVTVSDYVLELARETRRMSLAADDWALQDALLVSPSYDSTMEGHVPEGRALLEMSGGATLAMLMYAATLVDEALPEASADCPVGIGFGRFYPGGNYDCNIGAVCCDEGVIQCDIDENCGENEHCEAGCCTSEVTACENGPCDSNTDCQGSATCSSVGCCTPEPSTCVYKKCVTNADCTNALICQRFVTDDEGCCVVQID